MASSKNGTPTTSSKFALYYKSTDPCNNSKIDGNKKKTNHFN